MIVRPTIPCSTALWAMTGDELARLGRAHGIKVRRMASRALRIAALEARRDALAVASIASASSPSERLALASAEMSDAELADAVATLFRSGGRLDGWALAGPWCSSYSGISWRPALVSGFASDIARIDMFETSLVTWEVKTPRRFVGQAFQSLAEARAACDEALADDSEGIVFQAPARSGEGLKGWAILRSLALSRCELPSWVQLSELLLAAWELDRWPEQRATHGNVGAFLELRERVGERPIAEGSVAGLLCEELCLWGLVQPCEPPEAEELC